MGDVCPLGDVQAVGVNAACPGDETPTLESQGDRVLVRDDSEGSKSFQERRKNRILVKGKPNAFIFISFFFLEGGGGLFRVEGCYHSADLEINKKCTKCNKLKHILKLHHMRIGVSCPDRLSTVYKEDVFVPLGPKVARGRSLDPVGGQSPCGT